MSPDDVGASWWSVFYARRLRSHPFQYVGGVLPPAIVILIGVFAYPSEQDLPQLVGPGIFVALGGYYVIRWLGWAGAHRDGDDLVVTGVMWSRRIPLGQIDRIRSGYVAVSWRTQRGTRRWTPITPLWSKLRPLEFVTRHSNHEIRIMREWVTEARTAEP